MQLIILNSVYKDQTLSNSLWIGLFVQLHGTSKGLVLELDKNVKLQLLICNCSFATVQVCSLNCTYTSRCIKVWVNNVFLNVILGHFSLKSFELFVSEQET